MNDNQADQLRQQKLRRMQAMELLKRRQRLAAGGGLGDDQSLDTSMDSALDQSQSQTPQTMRPMFQSERQSFTLDDSVFGTSPSAMIFDRQSGHTAQASIFHNSAVPTPFSHAQQMPPLAGGPTINTVLQQRLTTGMVVSRPSSAQPQPQPQALAFAAAPSPSPSPPVAAFVPQQIAPPPLVEKELVDRGVTPNYAVDPVTESPLANYMGSERSFLLRAVPQGVLLQSYIRRYPAKFGFKEHKYEMYLHQNDVFVMSSRKRGGKVSSNYIISTHKDDLARKSQHFLGKLRSNFFGTVFHVYDSGYNVKRAASSTSGQQPRLELGVIIFKQNVLGVKGPRKLTVLSPIVRNDGTSVEFRPQREAESMMATYERAVKALPKGSKDAYHSNSTMVVMRNREPKWNHQLGAYVLNFNGRVTVASVKNFQLSYISDNNAEQVVLQFGRTGNDEFNLDFKWPISPIQAFGVALASFDSKLLCE